MRGVRAGADGMRDVTTIHRFDCSEEHMGGEVYTGSLHGECYGEFTRGVYTGSLHG